MTGFRQFCKDARYYEGYGSRLYAVRTPQGKRLISEDTDTLFALYEAAITAVGGEKPFRCLTCQDSGKTCPCGDPRHVPCQASHRAVPCADCATITAAEGETA